MLPAKRLYMSDIIYKAEHVDLRDQLGQVIMNVDVEKGCQSCRKYTADIL